MKFIPNSEIKQKMLKKINVEKISDLFKDIPQKIAVDDLNLSNGLTQQETEKKLKKIATKNKSYDEILSFIGGGIKPHYIPSVVKSIVSRSEFFSSYTPYQSEASQGFLQSMFEYQSIICEITGMDIANCSLYDGATALSEAALMCTRVNKKNRFVIPKNISYEKKCVLKNYAKGPGIEIKEIDYDKKTGAVDLSELKEAVDESTAGVYIENPNFFGVFEDNVDKIKKITENNDCMFVVGVDPVSLGIVKDPGSYGADIVIGEGRCFGNPMDFGGSGLGVFACKKKYLRQMPGRIIGMTNDSDGRKAFCMSLQTREQHIRRGRATSNICTNEGLNALSAVVYLSWLGGKGLCNLSKTNFEKGQKLRKKITSVDGFEKVFSGVHFNEFVIKTPINPLKLNKRLLNKKMYGGLVLTDQYPEIENCMLMGVTEIYDDSDIKSFISVLKEVI